MVWVESVSIPVVVNAAFTVYQIYVPSPALTRDSFFIGTIHGICLIWHSVGGWVPTTSLTAGLCWHRLSRSVPATALLALLCRGGGILLNKLAPEPLPTSALCRLSSILLNGVTSETPRVLHCVLSGLASEAPRATVLHQH